MVVLKKSVVAAVTAVAVAVGGVVVPAQTQAQELTDADKYQPEFGSGTGYTDETRGTYFIDSTGMPVHLITNVKIGEIPYPGVKFSILQQFGNNLYGSFRLTGGKIYPESFGIPLTAKITYHDGSSEYISGEFTVYPDPAFVSDNPVPNSPKPTVPLPPISDPKGSTTTVTTTITPNPVTTTVTKVEPTTVTNVATTTVTSAPATTTVTQAPVTTTVKATETTTAAGSTATVTPTPVTVTSVATTTVQPTTQDAPGSSDSNNLPGIIAAIVALIAAIGGGAYFMMNSAGFSLPFL